MDYMSEYAALDISRIKKGLKSSINDLVIRILVKKYSLYVMGEFNGQWK